MAERGAARRVCPALLPDPVQTLALRAGVLDGEAARAAWRDLDRALGSPPPPRRVAELLPRVSWNLRRLGVRHPHEAAFEELRRLHWGGNHQRLRRLGEVVDVLEAAGVRVAVLKGAALAPRLYEGLGERPFSDLDLLVDPAQVPAAAAALGTLGFEPDPPRHLDDLELRHAATFRAPPGPAVDLHWNLLKFSVPPALTPHLLAASPRVDLGGFEAGVLAPADHLFHALVHGVDRPESTAPKWALDAALWIQSPPEAIDWERLVQLTLDFRQVHVVEQGLGYLAEDLGLAVPEAVRARLAERPLDPAEAAALRGRATWRRRLVKVPPNLARYRVWAEARGRTPTPWGFAGFLGRLLGWWGGERRAEGRG